MADSPKKEQRLLETLAGAGIALPESVLAKLAQYVEAVLAANTRVNLTGAGSWEDLVNRHILDCMVGITKVEWQENSLVLDVGSGAGLPGIPLALVEPEIRLGLVETRVKKAGFLQYCLRLLGVRNAEVLVRRAEELGRDARWREGAERVTARGVAPLAVLLEYTLPLLARGGWLLAWKGPGLERELLEAQEALAELGGEVKRVYEYRLPDGRERRLLVVAKVGATPGKYPRRTGVASRRPLGRHFQ